MGPLVAALLAIEIHAAGDCPAASDVERRLAPLLEAGTEAPLADVATLRPGEDGTLLLALDDRGGRSLGQRRFPRGASCGEQAETVAVTLAVWEAQLHPEITLRLDRLAPPPPPVVVAVPAAPAAWTLTVGAAAAADWQPGTWAPAGRVEVALGRAGRRGRGRLALLGVGRHAQDVAPGQARWWRAAVSLGADFDLVAGRRAALSLGVGALAGLVSIAGAGYAVDHSVRSLDAGGEARLRLEGRAGRVRPWLGVSLAGWLRRQGLELLGGDGASALPRVEPMVALGADFVW